MELLSIKVTNVCLPIEAMTCMVFRANHLVKASMEDDFRAVGFISHYVCCSVNRKVNDVILAFQKQELGFSTVMFERELLIAVEA